MEEKYIGRLIGNTGNPHDLKIVLNDSFAAKGVNSLRSGMSNRLRKVKFIFLEE